MRYFVLLLAILLRAIPATAEDQPRPYSFGVLAQRSISLTAEYWNPILTYISKKSNVPLELRIARTASESTDMVLRGEIAFAYTNHLFTPERDKLGFKVIVRPDDEGIRGQIVVAENSPIKSLKELEGKKVAFANPNGFTGYYVPYDMLLRANIKPEVVFSGTQEASMGQLLHGQVAAAGVNSQVMADFARREQFAYRVLYSSETYKDLCVMASPKVSRDIVAAVRKALVGMKDDPEGKALLEAAAKLLSTKPKGFIPAEDSEYDNYRQFYKATLVPLPAN